LQIDAPRPLIAAVQDLVHGAMSISLPGSVVTLGAFDGVHRGHQALIARTVSRARSANLPAVAYTFDPHPAKILAPRVAPRTLTSVRERVRLLRSYGIDLVVVEPFDGAFAALTADDWVERWLVGRLHPRHVVVGFNFSYGKARGGSPEHLVESGKKHGFSVEVIEPVVIETIVVSSTRVREFLLEGNVEGAALLLGRPFAITGTVVRGDQRGRTIGFPTANVEPDHELLPEHGVYASRVDIGDAVVDGVTNVGKRPTFGGKQVTVESYLLDWSGDLYGKPVRVELIARLREERRFDGIDALQAQLARDVESARKVLKRR
jgi:riboflavin kinase/FMN adenylyltransferase